ncbi:MAG: FHA domain-containing protein [Lachnospiraceae bacterium]|nr:FHA domain-containing protein [Lachnospiraceae bacterium]
MEHQLDGTYKKEADGKTYFLLPKTKATYEEEMIRKAMPTGVLPMVKAEREECYKYEVTGRKTLAMTFERVPMNAEQVQKVLQGILSVLEHAAEYLLDEACFVLQAEHIYLSIPEYEVTLCYYPDYHVPFLEQMGKLFELLLNRVDYREEKAIALVYALYMQLQEPDMTSERLKKKLEEQQEKEGPQKESMQLEEQKCDYAEKKSVIRREGLPEKRKEQEGKGKKKMSLLERLRKDSSFLRQPVPVKKSLTEEGIRELQIWETKECPQTPAYVMEPAPEWGLQHTRVISVKKDVGCPTLVSEQSGKTIELTKFPFYIGSLSGYADYVVENDTVSRFHAKFLKQGEEVYLMDLNSTNGTKVNGRLLNVQESVKLSSGDCVTFAETEYYYFGV